MLNLVHRQSRLLTNRLKFHAPLIPRSLEYRLNHGHQADLLAEEFGIPGKNRL